ncbi:flavodoxin family protein [Paenibacillus antarcticus]|jgi:multimeric flavodoxin WrbA|uniref:NAD(P)H-dependent oxidoreductase n=1 Tax=Paenibacillus antarcticus TaxID=253703 RepID=A0A168LAS1_9BACL|nr:flavodoxin family protein [Paenibacillus antarcticus]OAB43109.1 NAD(P)H-dependent oxidoreductase [Paenibacillus antarcticus]
MGIVVLYGSSRRDGNSDTLADLLVEGLDVDRIYLSDYNLQPIVDYRHTEAGAYPDDDYHELIDRVLEQDTIVFATPIYWYGISGVLKTFVDRWSQSLRENREHFLAEMSAKKAYVIAIGDDEPHVKGLPLIQQFQYIFDFTRTQFDGYIIGEGNKPGSILEDAAALTRVEELRRRFTIKD